MATATDVVALEGVQTAKHRESSLHKDKSLEELLHALQEFGSPYLHCSDKSWSCSVDMNTNVAGAAFKVRSEYGFKTPHGAAAQCYDRVQQAVAQLTSAKAPKQAWLWQPSAAQA